MCAIRPSLPITKVVRFATPRSGISTPYDAETFLMKSLARGNVAFRCSSVQCRNAGRLSVETPTTCVSSPSKLAIPAWYAVISFVQPPVKAAGKNATTTAFFPRNSESVI